MQFIGIAGMKMSFSFFLRNSVFPLLSLFSLTKKKKHERILLFLAVIIKAFHNYVLWVNEISTKSILLNHQQKPTHTHKDKHFEMKNKIDMDSYIFEFQFQPNNCNWIPWKGVQFYQIKCILKNLYFIFHLIDDEFAIA